MPNSEFVDRGCVAGCGSGTLALVWLGGVSGESLSGVETDAEDGVEEVPEFEPLLDT